MGLVLLVAAATATPLFGYLLGQYMLGAPFLLMLVCGALLVPVRPSPGRATRSRP